MAGEDARSPYTTRMWVGVGRRSKVASRSTSTQNEAIMKKAHSAILLSLGDEVLGEVSREKTTNKLWAKLESRYMTKSLHNRLCLKKQLYTMQMHEGESVHKHIDNFNQIVLSLKNIDVRVDDEDQAILLLSSLAKSFMFVSQPYSSNNLQAITRNFNL